MAYSQGSLKVSTIKGAGLTSSIHREASPEDNRYITDGLRVVLVFSDETTALDEVDFFDGERMYWKYV